MTAQNRTTLKTLFETGDTILESSFVNLIDSMLDIVDTSSQTIASPIIFSGAATFNGSVTVTATAIFNKAIQLATGIVNVDSAIACSGQFFTTSYIASAIATGTTRASALPVNGLVTVLKVVSAGTNDGILLNGPVFGSYVQHIINATSVTAKIYPVDNITGGIDGQAVVSLFPNKRMTVFSVENAGALYQYTMVGDKTSV